jgi:anti-sigma regulatory factor (Ser/Thr protein kinase)
MVRAAGEARVADPVTSFRHEALLYGGQSEFLAVALAFIQAGTAADENVMVAVCGEKIDLLRSELGPDGEHVNFADVTDVGRNPATMIPLWSDFLERNARNGRPCRGISEPAWPERSDAALVECGNHEALVNVAFGEGRAWSLLCSFDAARLGAHVIDDARATHPFLQNGSAQVSNDDYDSSLRGWLGSDEPLTPSPPSTQRMVFGASSLSEVRTKVTDYASAAGLAPTRVVDFVLAVNELVGNSVRHGGGFGELRLWAESDTVLGEVSDTGSISDPLAGRRRPAPEQAGGRGLWIANQVCDLVQIRSGPEATVVRVHMAR